MVVLKKHCLWKRGSYLENVSKNKGNKGTEVIRNGKETRFINPLPAPHHKTTTIQKSELLRGGQGSGSSQNKNPLQEIASRHTHTEIRRHRRHPANKKISSKNTIKLKKTRRTKIQS